MNRVAVVGLCLLSLGTAGAAGEEKVALDQVPRPILAAVRARFEDAKITGAAREAEEGVPVYEVTIRDRGQHVDVTLTPEGEIVMIEREIAAKDLPAAVTRALAAAYSEPAYKIVEEIIKVERKQERLAYYEVLLVTADKKRLEVQVTPEGKIVEEENAEAEEDEE